MFIGLVRLLMTILLYFGSSLVLYFYVFIYSCILLSTQVVVQKLMSFGPDFFCYHCAVVLFRNTDLARPFVS